MSYGLRLFSIETMYKYQKSEDEDFFEHADHLCKFTEQQFEKLKDRLMAYEFEPVKQSQEQLNLKNLIQPFRHD